jgi:hypothetical protein
MFDKNWFFTLPEIAQKALCVRAFSVFSVNIFLLIGTLFILGCSSEPESDPLDKVEEKINSMEAVEDQIREIERTVRERDASERVYTHLFNDRDAILEIAEGKYNQNSPLHRALIQEMSWVILGELLERRPDFEVRVERERTTSSFSEESKPEVDPSIEKLPEEFK